MRKKVSKEKPDVIFTMVGMEQHVVYIMGDVSRQSLGGVSGFASGGSCVSFVLVDA